MTACVDSSVILRVLLGQPGRLPEWKRIRRGTASVLVELECLRTLDRLRIGEAIPETEIAARRQAVYRIVQALEVVEPSGIDSPGACGAAAADDAGDARCDTRGDHSPLGRTIR